MTLSLINPSVQTYVGKSFTNGLVPTNKLEDGENITTVDSPNSNAISSNDSLAQNVLKSLQNLGLNASDDEQTNVALQPFLQNLYSALAAGSNPPPPQPLAPPQVVNVSENVDSSLVESSKPTVTRISGGTNFKYNIDLSEADLGDYLPSVAANIQTALENIGRYISSKVTFDVKVMTHIADSDTLAQAGTTMITAKSNGKETVDSSFVSDSIYGVELSPSTPDSHLYINIDRLSEMSFDGKPTPDKFDFTSVLTHEILHGIAFSGLMGSGSELKTGYDELVTTINGTPAFIGKHALTANNGRPIPLSPESSGIGSSFYHVGIPSDLMSEAIKKGEVKTISALDVAMLEDMGIAVTGISPNSAPSKMQAAYIFAPPTPSDAVKNLLSSIELTKELQTNFDNLVSSLGGNNASPDVNLPNFLMQLAANSQELPPLQTAGSLFSESA